MLRITEVNIYSIDKGDDSWAVEGEILFEDDLTSAFEATYLAEEDELENLSLELDLDEEYDVRALKKWIVEAANDYED
ncbi:hypothetical protein [Anaerotignum sp. MB30-C6]|uniref:hypothetical protein n=1 Tax=Anaerotignum sp. MB30-C6 TaxID=3070814 RepID=UPI0027DDDCF4|nr:hypothetical protein [Anaerotignum sp. MB30-C6]WMI80635.1 hypothetical protein RBQ60_12475 [Anaerotignum sp. MB30-C6]